MVKSWDRGILARLPDRLPAVEACRQNIEPAVAILVLLPFWTSLLVRTISLEGCCCNSKASSTTFWSGFLVSSRRRPLTHDQQSVRHQCRHDTYLLPVMILPPLFVMKTIPQTYVRAAKSLARPTWTASLAGLFSRSRGRAIGAGPILVFKSCPSAYYITLNWWVARRATFNFQRGSPNHISSRSLGASRALGRSCWRSCCCSTGSMTASWASTM